MGNLPIQVSLTAISTDLERLTFLFPFSIFLRVARGYFLFMLPAKQFAESAVEISNYSPPSESSNYAGEGGQHVRSTDQYTG